MSAATNNPCGLRPISQPGGNVRVNCYRAGTSDDIYKYMPVQLDANGTAIAPGPATDLTHLLGSVVGWLDTNRAGFGSNLEDNTYLPKDTDAILLVADDPDQKFIIQADTGGTDLAFPDDVGSTCGFDYLQGSSGNDYTGIAKAELDQSDVATDTGGALRILDLLDKEDNDAGNWAKWIVSIMFHDLRSKGIDTVES